MAGTWLVPVTALRRTPGAQRHELRSGALGRLAVADTVVAADSPAVADVTLTAVDGGVEVAGKVAAEWASACRRCLRPVSGRMTSAVRELYRPLVPGGDEDDEETYPLGVDHLDLEPLVRDSILLGLPLAPLCAEDCAGLCARCGAELASGPCGCDTQVADPRWAALDALRLHDRD